MGRFPRSLGNVEMMFVALDQKHSPEIEQLDRSAVMRGTSIELFPAVSMIGTGAERFS